MYSHFFEHLVFRIRPAAFSGASVLHNDNEAKGIFFCQSSHLPHCKFGNVFVNLKFGQFPLAYIVRTHDGFSRRVGVLLNSDDVLHKRRPFFMVVRRSRGKF